MRKLLEFIPAHLGIWHAARTHRRFVQALERLRATQQRALSRALALVTDSEFGRRYALRRVRTPDDLRRAMPLLTYEDYRPYIDRVAAGETGALFGPEQRVVMFATSSGTTAQRKLIPVTPDFVSDYRQGWNAFGVKMLTDHPDAIMRGILQITGRHDEGHTPAGIPYGAITGLMARTQKAVVRRFYVGHPDIALLDDPAQRYYALMRFAAGRDVAFAITANPATLVRMAQTINDQAERLIRDVRDGTLSGELVPDAGLRGRLEQRLRPNAKRARALEQLRAQHGALRPRDMWRLVFVACWTGGSLGHYLGRVAELWGPIPVRDIGLLASEGRVSVPLDDGTPAGALAAESGCFEFIPAEEAEAAQPRTLAPHEVEVGGQYAVVLSNTTGLLRYRLDDVVRVTGWFREAPLIEFLHRAGRVSSVAGEKLTENHLVAAVQRACQELGLPEFDFVAAPVWDDPPYYRLSTPLPADEQLARTIDRALAVQNEEYASRRKSSRLNILRLRTVDGGAFAAMDRRLSAARGGTAEQYKRPCLFCEPGADDRTLELPVTDSERNVPA